MKHIVISILIAAIFPCMVFQPAAKGANMEPYQPGDNFHPGSDTSRNNPYLKIRKFELDILSPSSGVQFYNNAILFLSLSKMEERMISNHVSFGNHELFYASLNDTIPGDQNSFKINTHLIIPADGITFTSNMSRFYYSKLSDRDNKVKIYMAESYGSGSELVWETENVPLGFCSDNNYTHPTISHEGNLMIFSSDMQGGIGGLDLYISRYENNNWTNPVNMGKKINSEGSELYACLDRNNNLYFSSDELPGLGGYDIFFCNFNGTDWDEPINLYDQINTENDEVAFKINPEGKNIGFYTMIERSGIAKNKLKRTLYRIDPDAQYMNAKTFILSDILMDFASGSPIATTKPDEIKTKTDITQEESRIADSLRAEELIAEKLAQERRIADSLRAVEIENQRLAEEMRIADSLRLEELKQEEAEAAKNKVTYRVQILSSTKAGGKYDIIINGTKYNSWEYYYKGAWRITVGEFEKLSDAKELQTKCRNSGYEQAFVVAFVNNKRSLDMSLFRK